MAKIYNKLERMEALKMAEEIGAASAAQRLGIKKNTIYDWESRANEIIQIIAEVNAKNDQESIRSSLYLGTDLMLQSAVLKAAMSKGSVSEEDVAFIQALISYYDVFSMLSMVKSGEIVLPEIDVNELMKNSGLSWDDLSWRAVSRISADSVDAVFGLICAVTEAVINECIYNIAAADHILRREKFFVLFKQKTLYYICELFAKMYTEHEEKIKQECQQFIDGFVDVRYQKASDAYNRTNIDYEIAEAQTLGDVFFAQVLVPQKEHLVEPFKKMVSEVQNMCSFTDTLMEKYAVWVKTDAAAMQRDAHRIIHNAVKYALLNICIANGGIQLEQAGMIDMIISCDKYAAEETDSCIALCELSDREQRKTAGEKSKALRSQLKNLLQNCMEAEVYGIRFDGDGTMFDHNILSFAVLRKGLTEVCLVFSAVEGIKAKKMEAGLDKVCGEVFNRLKAEVLVTDLKRWHESNRRNKNKYYNSILMRKLSNYLNETPDAITAENVRKLAEDTGISYEYAYAKLLAAILGLDADGADLEVFHDYFIPMVRQLDPTVYENDRYYQTIKLPSDNLNRWEFRTKRLKPCEAFIYNDNEVTSDGRIIPRIGFFMRDFYYPAVLENKREWMTLLPNEIETILPVAKESAGKVLTYGLGLGYFAFLASENDNVESVTIVEYSHDVIALFQKYILPQFHHPEKIQIIEGNAFVYAEKVMADGMYDFVFVDIWHDVSDGAEMYLRFKAYETKCPNTRFFYWIEDSIKCYLNDDLWALM
ncbi:hypothetical protein [Pelotomaculum propionicicum]|uniref:Polyamine aminopropyltransferase n=1 Tax=Pelotomaculum propionicicum TaxID=258475 RepID=A0A4Y7RJ14_9FIRM|nr:hypothetical protein [Pelotomaculum propionicicum]TEB08709.1 Polyamine aminopropyltransferase [Pelotomaculum propionicicum]